MASLSSTKSLQIFLVPGTLDISEVSHRISKVIHLEVGLLYTPGSDGDQIRYLKAISNSCGRGSIGPKLNF